MAKNAWFGEPGSMTFLHGHVCFSVTSSTHFGPHTQNFTAVREVLCNIYLNCWSLHFENIIYAQKFNFVHQTFFPQGARAWAEHETSILTYIGKLILGSIANKFSYFL